MSETPRILIVEDQYFVAMDCEQHLRDAGFDCVGLVTTAAMAIEIAERERPDLIVMDIRLASREDGVQAATTIYNRFGIRSIFASGHADATVRAAAEPAHPLGWLDKPYSCERFIDTVRRGVDEVRRATSADKRWVAESHHVPH